MGEYEHLASYLKEMTSMMSLGFILENRPFGDLLNKVGIQLSQGISS